MPPATENSRLHLRAVLIALFVTFLWSTSWVLIKVGLTELPPVTFAGLRYLLAAMLLLGAQLATPRGRDELRALDRHGWALLTGLGLVMYSLTQGAQFVALGELPAIIVNLALSSTPVFVALLSIRLLDEAPTARQWLGIAVLLFGVLLYFRFDWPAEAYWFGIGVALFGTLANASASLYGRFVNRRARFSSLLVTSVSMTAGALLLFAAGLALEGLPRLDGRSWTIVVWLALVNTAFAFTLWNQTLRRLTATESSVINNSMLFQIPILAWIFLGEHLGAIEIVALLVVGAGVLIVQLSGSRRGRAREDRVVPRADPGTPPEPS